VPVAARPRRQTIDEAAPARIDSGGGLFDADRLVSARRLHHTQWRNSPRSGPKKWEVCRGMAYSWA